MPGPITAADIPFASANTSTADRQFEAMGPQRYRLTALPAGIVLELDRLTRHRDGLIGELSVTLNGNFPHARKSYDGVVTIGDLNLSSVQARSTRAKLLAERTDSPATVDWYGLIEELTVRTITAERSGQPALALAELPTEQEPSDAWEIDGLPILQALPMILYGSGSSGKSYLALWLAGRLCQLGVPVLYCDWEFAASEHRQRLYRLFHPMPAVTYVRCDRPLVDEVDRLLRVIQDRGIRYVVCDSIGFAADGTADAQESASGYFRALRQFGIGSLNLTHTPKAREEGKHPEVYGSVYYQNGARSIWHIERSHTAPKGELQVGLYHRKNNVGPLLPALGYRFTFGQYGTSVGRMPITESDDLTAGLPLIERVVLAVAADGPMPRKDLADALGVTPGTLRVTLHRHRGRCMDVAGRICLRLGAGSVPDP